MVDVLSIAEEWALLIAVLIMIAMFACSHDWKG